MRIVFCLVLVLVSAARASAQDKADVKIEPLMSGLYTVTVRHIAFEAMCQALARKVPAEADATDLRVLPKALLPSRVSQVGEIWTVGSRGLMIEVPSKELPRPLWGVRGAVATLPHIGTCYLKDNYFHNTEEISFVLASRADAQAFAQLFR